MGALLRYKKNLFRNLAKRACSRSVHCMDNNCSIGKSEERLPCVCAAGNRRCRQ